MSGRENSGRIAKCWEDPAAKIQKRPWLKPTLARQVEFS